MSTPRGSLVIRSIAGFGVVAATAASPGLFRAAAIRRMAPDNMTTRPLTHEVAQGAIVNASNQGPPLTAGTGVSGSVPRLPEPDPPVETPAPAVEVKAGTDVERHEIVGESTSFPAGTTVWVLSLVLNGEGKIKHVWKRDGKEVWTSTLPVGFKRWATSSRRTIPAAGSWQVDVTTEAGELLGTVSFAVQ